MIYTAYFQIIQENVCGGRSGQGTRNKANVLQAGNNFRI